MKLQMMMPTTLVLATTLLFAEMPATEGIVIPPLLSKTEADAIIEVEMVQRHQAATDRRELLLSEPAGEVSHIGPLGRGVVMRRVAARPWTHWPQPSVNTGNAEALPEGTLKTRTIQLSITVFDHQASELVWREGQESHTAISNINFNHFAPLGSFEQDGITWQFLCLVENIDSEKSRVFAQLALAAGHEFTPRNAPDISMLDSDKPDYAVYADDAEQVPDAMIESLNALHRHYADHGPRLEAQWQRAQTLHEARRDWHEANPPVPRDTIINFWPVQSRQLRARP